MLWRECAQDNQYGERQYMKDQTSHRHASRPSENGLTRPTRTGGHYRVRER
jgi:hypothetical protein